MATLAKLLGVFCLVAAVLVGGVGLLAFLGAAGSTDTTGRTSDTALGLGFTFLVASGGFALMLAAVGAGVYGVGELLERDDRRGRAARSPGDRRPDGFRDPSVLR